MAHKLLLSIDEAADLIGVKRSNFYKLMRHDGIPSVKVGHLRRIPAAELEAWVQRQVAEQATHEEG
jgi:excisionase family DNA binding protein